MCNLCSDRVIRKTTISPLEHELLGRSPVQAIQPSYELLCFLQTLL